MQDAGGVLRTQQEAWDAVGRMLASLGDPYSQFLPPARFRQALRRPLPAELKYLEAQFIGVGIQFGEAAPGGGRYVEAALAGSPAEAAGIRRGDHVLAMGPVPAEDLTKEGANSVMRGPVGSILTVTLAPRVQGQRPAVLELERRKLPQPAVRETQLTTVDGRPVTYLRLNFISSDATRAVQQAVARGESRGAAGYILDLRNNPGGVFEEAVAISSLFLDCDCDIAETIRNEQVIDNVWNAGRLSTEIFPDLPGPLTSRPVVVLVNSSTASASEVLSGALHDNGRALVIGERTFGKGVVQYYFPLEDGSGVKVTVAKYLTPDRYDISRAGGLPPDVYCSDYPHGVLTEGPADRCVLTAVDQVVYRSAQHDETPPPADRRQQLPPAAASELVAQN